MLKKKFDCFDLNMKNDNTINKENGGCYIWIFYTRRY